VELTNEFRVSVPIADAWNVLTDVERIAPCLPGAQLQEVDGDDYLGKVKVKVGPITAQYKGKATFLERNDERHVAVLRAEGRDTRGQGNANATITATLTPDGEGTAVKVVTDLTITGKVAQFGRGVLVDVSGKLLTQFVNCLETDLLSGRPGTVPEPEAVSEPVPEPVDTSPGPEGETVAATEEPAWAPPAPAPVTPPPEATPLARRKIDHQPAPPVDLLEAAGVPVAKRAIPLVAGVLVIVWFLRRRRARR
jgi:hypothetical protein